MKKIVRLLSIVILLAAFSLTILTGLIDVGIKPFTDAELNGNSQFILDVNHLTDHDIILVCGPGWPTPNEE